METNPNTPRQRNRRTDRAAQTPAEPVVQRVQTNYQQTGQTVPEEPIISQAIPMPQAVKQPQQAPVTRTVPQAYRQSPGSMYQQPVRPTSYQQPAHVQNGYLQRPQAPTQHVQHLTQPVPVVHKDITGPQQSVPAAQPRTGWTQPATEVPHARSTARQTARAIPNPLADDEPDASPDKRRLPGWLTTAVSLAIILVLALGAAYWLMQAYLVTQENKRIAAYEAVLNHYHITWEADGTHRVTWQDEIEYYAAQYNLQPAFVIAIIRMESSFRTNAESSVGARGLMQMMPDTAEWIAGKLDDDSYTFDRMWDGETNIRYGCWYLDYLSRLFRGDAELVSAAYHAGQTTITQWLSDRNKSSDGLTLDLNRLSDGPTKQYIGRVTQAYGIYQSLLYPDAAFGNAGAVSAGSPGTAAAER